MEVIENGSRRSGRDGQEDRFDRIDDVLIVVRDYNVGEPFREAPRRRPAAR
nr:hypothetical protein [Tsukamurella asaccharolytica]